MPKTPSRPVPLTRAMESLRRRRGVLRATVTKKMTALDALLQNPAAPTLEFQTLLDIILDKQRALHELDSQIQAALTEEEFDADVLDAIDYDEQICALRTRVRSVTSPAPSASAATAESGEPCGSAPSQPRPGTPQTTQGTRFAALPRLQIPNFSGDRRDWQGFWDQFESSIHSNATLPRIEKFKYLLSYLTGPAKDAIEGIRLADDNYDFAVKIITNRFGRKDLLVDDHLDKLLALEPVRNSADTDKLRVLYDTVTFRINALEGLGVSPDQYSVVLHRVLLRTLPHDLGLLYRQRLKEAQQDASEVSASPSARSKEIKVILDFLRVQVEIREESASDRSVPSTHRVQERGQSSPSRVVLPTAMTLSAQCPSAGRPRCQLCNAQDHVLAHCTSAVSPEEKRKRLQANRCCFRCGKHNHFARHCRTANSLVCSHCSRRHLTSLCDIQLPAEGFWPTSPESKKRRSKGAAINNASAVTSTSTSGAGPMSVLLQTGRAWALGKSHQRLVRFSLDTGSQRTFIRRDVSQALCCPVNGVERLTLSTFGDTRPRAPVTCNRVSLTLKSQHNGQNITVEALEVPSICTITSPPVSKEIVRVMSDQGQVAADARLAPMFRENQVSVLIGSDAYWKVATVNVSRISPTLMAVETVLGWTVQGTQLDSSSLSTAHSSALFLSLGESSTEDTAVDNDRSSMCRLEVSETWGTTENSTFNDPAVQPFELQDRKENHRDQVLLRNEEPRSDVANHPSFQKVKLDFKTKRGDPCIMKVLGTQWKGSDSLVLREDNITMFVSEKPVAKSEAMPTVPSALLAKQREHVPPAETLPSSTLVDSQRAPHTVTAPSSRQEVSSVAPSDMGIPPAASIHPRGQPSSK